MTKLWPIGLHEAYFVFQASLDLKTTFQGFCIKSSKQVLRALDMIQYYRKTPPEREPFGVGLFCLWHKMEARKDWATKEDDGESQPEGGAADFPGAK